jgi:hypothetical protein
LYTVELPEGDLSRDILIECLVKSYRIKKLILKNIYPKEFLI